MDTHQGVLVAVRVRPLNSREKKGKDIACWELDATQLVDCGGRGAKKGFSFSHVFDPSATNLTVFQKVAAHIVERAMMGYNGTVFAYGQTGTGKTYSMLGSPDEPGVVRQSIDAVFSTIERSGANCAYLLRASYLEVYNERINDLLVDEPGQGTNLRIVGDDPVKGAVIRGLTEEIVTSREGMLDIISRGESNRHYSATAMNAESSRSHTIYRLIIESKKAPDADDAEPEDGGAAAMAIGGSASATGTTATSYLNLVDLAGSERASDTGATGKQLKEGANINKSLLTLGVCIGKLGELQAEVAAGSKKTSKVFIPFRDSKMTRILKNSLGGNTFTSVLCAMSPAKGSREETLSTLAFAGVCKKIQAAVTKNEVVDDKSLLKQYRKRISELTSQLQNAHVGDGSAPPAAPVPSAVPGELGDIAQKNKELEEKVKRLQSLVMVSGETQRDSLLTGPGRKTSAGGRTSGRLSLAVCVSASTPISSATASADLFNIVEEDEEDEGDATEGDAVDDMGGALRKQVSAGAASEAGVPKRRARKSVFGNGSGALTSQNSGDASQFRDMLDSFSKASKVRTTEHRTSVEELEAEIRRLREELELERDQNADREEESMSYLEHRRELALVEQDLVAVAEENTQLRKKLEALEHKNTEIAVAAGGERSVVVSRLQVELKEMKQQLAQAKGQLLAAESDSRRKAGGEVRKLSERHADEVFEIEEHATANDEVLRSKLESSQMEAACLQQRVNDLEGYYAEVQAQYSRYQGQYEQLVALRKENESLKTVAAASSTTAVGAGGPAAGGGSAAASHDKLAAMKRLRDRRKRSNAGDAAEDAGSDETRDKEDKVAVREREADARYAIANRLESEWRSRRDEIVAALDKWESSSTPGQTLLSDMLKEWETATIDKFEELVALEVHMSQSAASAPQVKTSSSEAGGGNGSSISSRSSNTVRFSKMGGIGPAMVDELAEGSEGLWRDFLDMEEKSMGLKKWKRRYFVLEAGSCELQFYEDDSLLKCKVSR